MTRTEKFKIQLKLEAWARHKAEQEGTKTHKLNEKWCKDNEYKISLIKKWREIAIERQFEIIG